MRLIPRGRRSLTCEATMNRLTPFLVLGIFMLGVLVPAVQAQRNQDGSSPSHRRLGKELEDLLSPEDALAKRLMISRELRKLQDLNPEQQAELMKLAKELM